MSNPELEWSANQYAIGSFIQHYFSDRVLANSHFAFKPRDTLLDIGCGDGAYTLKIAKKIPNGKVTGRDPSEKMIEVAQQRILTADNVVFECENAEALAESGKYSVITAFWCMQWMSDVNRVLANIYRALKPGGRFFAVYPSANCLYVRLYKQLKATGRFPVLDNFQVPIHFPMLESCENTGELLGFQTFRGKLHHEKLKLPDIETFQKFIDGFPFFKGQVPDADIPALNAAMLDIFQAHCKEHHNGEYYFEDEMIVLIGIKKRQVELTPDQRSEVIAKQDVRGDLIEPASQRPKSGLENGGSTLKVRPDLANQPQGVAPNLNTAPSANPEAARNEKALTAAPTHELSNQLKAGMALQNTPKLAPKG